MAPSVQRYFEGGLATSTQRTYSAATKRFHTFCIQFNVLNPFPVSEQSLCSFAAYLADQGLSPQTIRCYMSAIRNMQISLGLPDPSSQGSLPMLKRVQAGIRRAHLSKGSPPRIRLPITPTILEKIRISLDRSENPNKVVLWAISCTAFFGFFRLGELLPHSAKEFRPTTDLAWGDVAVDDRSNPSMICIHLKKSKCDQFGAGADIIVGRTGSTICPVAAIVAFIALRGDKPGPFFLDSTGQSIAKDQFIQEIRNILNSLGIPQHQYAGHSFRIGAATSAAQAGVPDSTIQTLGRWHSAAFLQYIRMPREQLAAITPLLLNIPTQTPSRSS